VDKHDDTWVNGERVGGISWEVANAWSTPRIYNVPARLIAEDGVLAIAVRARSHIYHGGLFGPAGLMHLAPQQATPGEALPLAGTWRYRVEQDWGTVTAPAKFSLGDGNPNSPATLYDSRLAPLAPYALRGVLWYQGESNVGEPARYRGLLRELIWDWRRAFGQPLLPFYQVQLASFMQPAEQPRESAWAALREAQAAIVDDLPMVDYAVAIDLGEKNDIHPQAKRPVAERLARLALHQVYGRAITTGGPRFRQARTRADGRLEVTFSNAAVLRTRDGAAPTQVAIAGSDRIFRWARSAIEGGCLVAWHDEIRQPVAIRYAWSDFPVGANLVGVEDLPVAPFRSDVWPIT